MFELGFTNKQGVHLKLMQWSSICLFTLFNHRLALRSPVNSPVHLMEPVRLWKKVDYQKKIYAGQEIHANSSVLLFFSFIFPQDI